MSVMIILTLNMILLLITTLLQFMYILFHAILLLMLDPCSACICANDTVTQPLRWEEELLWEWL